MRAGLLLLVTLVLSCTKVPLQQVNAGFSLADAAWFAEEETLFVFYEVFAEQGIGDPSVLEVTFDTDEERVGWTALTEFEAVHTHLPIECGPNARCGSTSIHVPLEPRNVRFRLRYHRDGELALDAPLVYNVVGRGPAHINRSLVVYGVFDEANALLQWRARHQFPTLRNAKVTELGLRRRFIVEDARYGSTGGLPFDNPYGYALGCPTAFASTEQARIETLERAIFHPEPVPIAASEATTVCATTTVFDPLGPFVAGAIAQKNPEVRPAFPVLRTPIRAASVLPFFLAPCDRVIDEEHADMQRQRLQLEDVPTTCIDDWQNPAFVNELANLFRDAIETQRPAGGDMVLAIALHQDEAGVAPVVEAAMAQVVPQERHRSSPRVAGAFLYDSTSRGLSDPTLGQATLWCPAIGDNPDASNRTCPTQPDIPNIDLGPFSFNTLPILPTRTQYLRFIGDFSVSQAGSVEELTYLTPEFATTSDHVDLGEFGVVTFLNGEEIASQASDAFSFCPPDSPLPVVVRSPLMSNPQIRQALLEACVDGDVSPDLCLVAELGLLPIESLSDWHFQFAESQYELGLFWDFPFLLRMEYRAFVAGSLTAFGLSVPFGIGAPAESFFGTEQWIVDEFPMDEALLQCRRFCDHPTFDSAGVYHVTDPFRTTYGRTCYLPRFPRPGDSGFPLDP